MEYLSLIATVAIIHILGAMSPGPDFVLISHNSLVYSKKTAIYTALGLSLGIFVHVFYSLVGIGVIISQSIVLFTIIKYIGAGYLLYLGIKALTTKNALVHEIKKEAQRKDIPTSQAIKMGFLTNATNPKVTLFFLSLFTLVINPETPMFIKAIMGLEMVIATFLWFAFVATLFSHPIVKSRIQHMQHHVERITGVALIALGIKLAFTQK